MAGLPDVLPGIGNSYLLYVHPGDFVSLFAKPDSFPLNRIRELLRLVPSSLPFVLLVLAVLSFLLTPTGVSAATPTRSAAAWTHPYGPA